MANASDPRSLLGVTENCDLSEIESAYQSLLTIWNPERFTDDQQIERLARNRINQLHRAYLSLVDDYTHARAKTPSDSPTQTSKLLHRLSLVSRTLSWQLMAFSEAIWILCSPRVVVVAALVFLFYAPPHRIFLRRLGISTQVSNTKLWPMLTGSTHSEVD